MIMGIFALLIDLLQAVPASADDLAASTAVMRVE